MSTVARVIFQQGIDLRLDDRGIWFFPAAHPAVERLAPRAIIEKFGVRPVLAYQRTANYPDVPMLLPSAPGDVLGVQLTGLSQGAFQGPPVAIFDALHIQNVVGAVHYHCAALAERYGNVCTSHYETFSRIPGHQMNDDRVNFGGQYELYYEFEALVTAAKRAYDATRYVLWRQFGPAKGSVPSSFDRTIENLPRLPSQLRSRLEQSWKSYGAGLKEYRDCIQHYVPLGGPAPYAALTRKHGVWTIAVRIPDNPAAKSTKNFKYDLKLDALNYGWNVTIEIFEVAKAILAAARAAETA